MLMTSLGLTFSRVHDTGGAIITGFMILEGQEQPGAESLLQFVDQGYELSLRNDLDEGGEGSTGFRRGAAGYERLIGGHGWQSGWKPVGRQELLSEVAALAAFTRPPHPTGSLVRRKR